MADEDLLRPAQASQLRMAVSVLRELYDDGYIDWRFEGSPDLEQLADQLAAMLHAYAGCRRKP